MSQPTARQSMPAARSSSSAGRRPHPPRRAGRERPPPPPPPPPPPRRPPVARATRPEGSKRCCTRIVPPLRGSAVRHPRRSAGLSCDAGHALRVGFIGFEVCVHQDGGVLGFERPLGVD